MIAPPPHPLTSAPGAHALPWRFSSSAAPAPPRRRRTGLIVGLVAGVAVVAGLAVTQVSANAGYDDAAQRVDAAERTVAAAKMEVRHRNATLTESTDAGHVILDTGSASLPVAADLSAALSDAVGAGEEAGAAAEDAVATTLPSAVDKPVLFWELFGATAQLVEDENELGQVEKRLRSAAEDASAANDAVTDSGVALVAAAGAAAAPFEAAHISARNDAVIALRNAAADAIDVTLIDDTAASAYVALQDAAGQVLATEKAELAEKDGPLKNARLEIEAFARSLAPGVLLEFDWDPVVNGAGYNGSMGGYTTWWWDEPGRAVIQLSNSVAEQWPADRSKALVAHEVGHAISVKCAGKYDSSTQDSIEKWATAWAISMGFTDDANGVWAYGYPPQNYIDAAADCR